MIPRSIITAYITSVSNEYWLWIKSVPKPVLVPTIISVTITKIIVRDKAILRPLKIYGPASGRVIFLSVSIPDSLYSFAIFTLFSLE